MFFIIVVVGFAEMYGVLLLSLFPPSPASDTRELVKFLVVSRCKRLVQDLTTSESENNCATLVVADLPYFLGCRDGSRPPDTEFMLARNRVKAYKKTNARIRTMRTDDG